MKKRLVFVDIAKFLGIIVIILAHTFEPNIRIICTTFMVPLFFFLSGYTYNFNNKIEDFNYVKKFFITKFKNLYIPFIKYSIIFILLHNLFLYIGIYTSNDVFSLLAIENNMLSQWSGFVTNYYYLKNILYMIIKALTFGVTEQLIRPLWFIPALFVSNIAFVLVNYISNLFDKKKGIIIKIVIMILLIIIGYNSHFPRYISSGLSGVYYLYIGYLCRKYDSKIKFNFFFSVVLAIILILISPYSYIGMMSNAYSNIFDFLFVPFIGIYIIMYISKLFESLNEKNIVRRLLIYGGMNTMIILTFQLLSFKIVTLFQIIISKQSFIYLACYPVYKISIYSTILYCFVGIFIPLVVKYICEKII